LVMGTSDLAKTLRVPHTTHRTGLLTALSQCVLAARESGLDILDGVQLDLHDQQALEQVCKQGCELGFDGKTLIHPRQIDSANRAFAPDANAIAHARRIATAWAQAQSDNKALVVVDGQLIEHPHADEANRVLAIAEAIALTSAELPEQIATHA
jgi:citrate lyase subunit beta/citryl-CoA lyase